MEATVGEAGWRNEAWDDAKKGRTYAIFRDDTVLDKAASEKAGRPIHKPVILLEKIVPGDSLNRPVRPIRESDKEEYPVEWARYQQKAESQIPGTPLEAVTWLARTQVAEMKAINVHTVEQLATLPDSVKYMGLQDLRRKAESFLKASQDTALTDKLDATVKAQNAQIEELKKQIAQLAANQPATPQQGGRETLSVGDRKQR